MDARAVKSHYRGRYLVVVQLEVKFRQNLAGVILKNRISGGVQDLQFIGGIAKSSMHR